MSKPHLDAAILAALDARPAGVMTYVIDNILSREQGLNLGTANIRRCLRRMQAAGQVQLAFTSYARQLCWQRVPTRPGPAAPSADEQEQPS